MDNSQIHLETKLIGEIESTFCSIISTGYRLSKEKVTRFLEDM